MELETYLDLQKVPYEKHTHPRAYTAQELAQAEHVSGYIVAKPVVVRTATGFAMCVLAAPKHLDLRRAGQTLNEKNLRLASEQEMMGLFPDCELGAEPPLGKMFGLKTVMDAGLKDDTYLVMQAGSHSRAVKIARREWERVCQPTVADIATD